MTPTARLATVAAGRGGLLGDTRTYRIANITGGEIDYDAMLAQGERTHAPGRPSPLLLIARSQVA